MTSEFAAELLRAVCILKSLAHDVADALPPAKIEEIGRQIEGEQYKRVPTGFAADHPRADLLRYKGMYTMSPILDPKVVASSRLVDVCFQVASDSMPLHRWLVKVNALA